MPGSLGDVTLHNSATALAFLQVKDLTTTASWTLSHHMKSSGVLRTKHGFLVRFSVPGWSLVALVSLHSPACLQAQLLLWKCSSSTPSSLYNHDPDMLFPLNFPVSPHQIRTNCSCQPAQSLREGQGLRDSLGCRPCLLNKSTQ